MLNEPPTRVIERLRAASFTVDGTGCIETTYATAVSGYCAMGWKVDGKRFTQLGHRITWFAAHGDIPQGMTIDHICRNRRCVNVDHLRLLTNVENARDNGMARRTHCPHGHPYDESNTLVEKPRSGRGASRKCRTCVNARFRVWQRRRRAALLLTH